MRVRAAVLLLLAGALAACGGEGGADGGSPAATSAGTPAAATEADAASPTSPSPTAPSSTSVARVEAQLLLPAHYAAWRESDQTIGVHFVVRVRNIGDVPVEVTRIEYELLDRANAAFEFGSVARAYPPILAPGEDGVIGETVGRVSYSDPKEITGVSVFIDTRPAEAALPALDVRDIAIEPAGAPDRFFLTGSVSNPGDTAADCALLGVALADEEGDWIGFVGGSVGDAPLAPGSSTPFSLGAVLPPGIDAEVASFEAFAAAAPIRTGCEGTSSTSAPPMVDARRPFEGEFRIIAMQTVGSKNDDDLPPNVIARDGSW